MHNSVYTHFFVICYCNYLVWHSLLLIYKTIISLWIIKITLINNRCQKSGMTEMYGLVPKQQTYHKEKDKTWWKKERNEWGQCSPPEPHHTIRIKNTTAEMRETTYHSSRKWDTQIWFSPNHRRSCWWGDVSRDKSSQKTDDYDLQDSKKSNYFKVKPIVNIDSPSNTSWLSHFSSEWNQITGTWTLPSLQSDKGSCLPSFVGYFYGLGVYLLSTSV